MRKAIIMLLMAVTMSACEKTPEQRAEKLIMEYLEKNANDPSSVQDLDVGKLIDIDEDEHGRKGKYKYAVITYRAKNGYGALMKSDMITVRFDKDVTRIICFDCFK